MLQRQLQALKATHLSQVNNMKNWFSRNKKDHKQKNENLGGETLNQEGNVPSLLTEEASIPLDKEENSSPLEGDTEKDKGWFSHLKIKLKKSSTRLSEGLSTLLSKRKLDNETLQQMEDLLIMSDLGVEMSSEIIEHLKKQKFNQEVSLNDIKHFLGTYIEQKLDKVEHALTINREHKPFIILIVGVNGSGKTTTIGKLAKKWKDDGYKIRLIAGDTFRAAAVEQLCLWGERLNVPVATIKTGGDAAGLIFDVLSSAQKNEDDIVLIDTAGRLHTKANLMEELEKIARVIKKIDPSAPHACLFIADATTGQNLYKQVETFHKHVPLSGLIMTKLDGTAKGGILIGLNQKFHLPIHAIGIGEGAEDLQPFDGHKFAEALIGLEE